MLQDPAFSFEYFNRDQRLSQKVGGLRWKIMDAQLDYMQTFWHLTDTLTIACGRSCGKTSTVEHLIFTIAITQPKKETGYVVRNQRHANVLIEHLIAHFNRSAFTREFLVSVSRHFHLHDSIPWMNCLCAPACRLIVHYLFG